MKCNTAMITAILQAITTTRHVIWCTCRRFTTINDELHFLSEVCVFFYKESKWIVLSTQTISISKMAKFWYKNIDNKVDKSCGKRFLAIIAKFGTIWQLHLHRKGARNSKVCFACLVYGIAKATE